VIVHVLILWAVIGSAAVLSVVVHRRRTTDADPPEYGLVLSFVGAAYGLLLGLLVVFAVGHFNDVRTEAQREASSLVSLYDTLRVYPSETADPVHHDLFCYMRSIVHDEWPSMARGNELEAPRTLRLGDRLRANLRGYTGMVNFETIDARIIEVHLRFSDQWPDLYGAGWTAALVRLYAEGVWDYPDEDRRDGYSVVLFGPHGLQYWHPDPELIAELLKAPDLTSIQITFHEDKPPRAHSMPPGGFRLAIVNGWDLEAGMQLESDLFGLCFATEDQTEGMDAFLGKRQPEFRGR